MSDNEAPKWKAYDYRGNSSVVLQPAQRAKTDEPTGEPESLRGKELPKFGDLAQRTKPKVDKEKIAKQRKKREQKKKKKKRLQHESILDAAGSIDPSMYRPRTEETQAVYEQILDFLSPILGDYPQDVMRSAADEVLAVLKDDRLPDPERRQEIEQILNTTLDTAQFSKLVSLGKGITDYYEEQEGDEEVMDDEVGVGVVFPEEEEDEKAQSGSDVEDVVADEEESIEEEEEEEEGEKQEEPKDMEGLTIQNEDEEVEEEDEDLVDARDIDAYWLNRQLSKFFDDPEQCQNVADEIFEILSQKGPSVENQLVMKLGYEKEKFDFVKMLMKNKNKIVYCTKLRRAQNEQQREEIRHEMKQNPDLRDILEYLEAPAATKEQRIEKELKLASARKRKEKVKKDQDEAMPSARTLLDLDAMAFEQGGHTMSNKQCRLPEGSYRTSARSYEEVHIPAPKPHSNLHEGKVSISQLPKWAQPVFTEAGVKELNPVQSRMYEPAMHSNENLLLCAPTGAGKTNVAVLTILHEIGKCLREDGSIDKDQFKVIYIAPMKALVQEMVMNFSKRFESYGLKVHELSGDMQMTKQQMAETQIIVTTPEKWDIVTRKTGDRTILQSVKLIIMDEIHLLHDDRGPVLESIIARTLRHIETTQEMIRIVGLSATLPNYLDVAAILRINPPERASNWFFDSTFRPVPLEQQYIGVTERKALKRLSVMNEITYEKVLQMKGKPTLVFVHSRKETAKTGKMVRDTALERDTLSQLVSEDAGHRSNLQKAVERAKHRDLKELLPYGIAIHHAGLAKEDRQLVEALFENHVVKILVSTSTLAWGVNLPAHAVIIKGTQFYNPERGAWMELSPMDVMQMVGRAGRPQYDRLGRGIMITSHNELQYYLSLLNQQLPVESQMVSRLADSMNAEIVLGTVSNVDDAVDWLGYTYLYVRMLRNPNLYQVPISALDDDRALVKFRADLVHSAATALDKANLIKYDRKTGSFQVTDLGRVASHYYITARSMTTYNEHLKPKMSDVELFRLFSLSSEFRYMTVRQEEKLEMQKLLNRVPIPVKESMEEPSAKVNVLLQAYISRLHLEGFALIADMVYVTQSAGRLMRALFEIVLKRGWAQLAWKTLTMCKMIDKRMWSSQSPLRQFPRLPLLMVRRIESKELTWDRFYHLTPDQIGEHLRYPQMGRKVYNLIHQVPRLTVTSHDVRTITRSLVRVELTITPDFRYVPQVHGPSEPFWIIVEDGDSDNILHHELFLLKAAYARNNEPHVVEFTVPLRDPMDPVYFVRILSDRWLGSETVLPLPFRSIILPERYPPHTELLDLQPKPVNEVHEDWRPLYSHIDQFNPIQTQVFSTMYHTDEHVFVGAPPGSGKTYCAELALLRMFEQEGDQGRAVYIGPTEPIAAQRYRDWLPRLSKINKRVVMLTGALVTDLALVRQADVVISTPDNWDRITRRWKSLQFVRELSLYIVDEAHLIAGPTGPTLEVITSRARFISQLAQSRRSSATRIVALSVPVSNAKDLAAWMGVSANNTFNFHPNVRPVPLEITLQGFPQYDHSARMLAMSKPTYRCMQPGRTTLVFAPSRRRAKHIAVDMAAFAAAEEDPYRLINNVKQEDMTSVISQLSDPALQECVRHGIAFYHQGLPEEERGIIERLYGKRIISALIADHEECWGMDLTAQCVVIHGTQYFDSTIHNFTDYRIPDMLQMMGRASSPSPSSSSSPQDNVSGQCVILCPSAKKQFYRKFLHEAFPVESHLHHFLEDHMNAEVVSGVVDSKQAAVHYLAWTFLYRRLPKNPSYYNLHGTTAAHIADYLSELVEVVLQNLENSGCIQVSDDDVSPVNLGFIAAFHRISYATAEIFHSSLAQGTKLRMLIEILCAAVEFEDLPVRPREDEALQRLARHLPLPIPKQRSTDTPRYTDPHNKANILLQTHFSRTRLRSEMERDKKQVLERSVQLLHAIVDVVSSNNWLRPALATMELCQMVVQAMWERDSQLKQLPHVTEEAIERCRRHDITTIFELIDSEDNLQSLLGVDDEEMKDVVRACNRYPDIDITRWDVEDRDALTTEEPAVLHVTLSRNPDQDVAPVHAPFFPGSKLEEWWLVVGDTRRNRLYANKRVTVGRNETTVKLNVALPKAGDYELQLYMMSDSYIGCDQEIDDIKLHVEQGESDDEEEEEEEGENKGNQGDAVEPMDTN